MMNILKTAKNLLQKISSQPFESLALLGVFPNSIIKASDNVYHNNQFYKRDMH